MNSSTRRLSASFLSPHSPWHGRPANTNNRCRLPVSRLRQSQSPATFAPVATYFSLATILLRKIRHSSPSCRLLTWAHGTRNIPAHDGFDSHREEPLSHYATRTEHVSLALVHPSSNDFPARVSLRLDCYGASILLSSGI